MPKCATPTHTWGLISMFSLNFARLHALLYKYAWFSNATTTKGSVCWHRHWWNEGLVYNKYTGAGAVVGFINLVMCPSRSLIDILPGVFMYLRLNLERLLQCSLRFNPINSHFDDRTVSEIIVRCLSLHQLTSHRLLQQFYLFWRVNILQVILTTT